MVQASIIMCVTRPRRPSTLLPITVFDSAVYDDYRFHLHVSVIHESRESERSRGYESDGVL